MNTDIIKDEKMKDQICAYLEQEISIADAELEPLRRKWDKIRRQRENETELEVKNFPWDDASNISMPLSAMNTNTIFASMKATFSGKMPFFHLKSRLEQFDAAECLQDYFNELIESKHHVDLRGVNNTIFYEVSSLGIQWVHVPWLVDEFTYKRETEGGIEEVTITKRDCPVVVPILPEDVFYRTRTATIQGASWIGIRYRVTEQELKQRQHFGTYDDVDKVIGNVRTDLTPDNIRKMEERIGMQSQASEPYEIFEVYLYWDVDEDGLMESIRVWYERSSSTLLRAELNGLGIRPIACFRYLPYPGKETAGIGIGKMCEKLQDGCDALLNMAINSTFISSLQMFATPLDSGIGPREEFYPFKQLKISNPRDFVPITFPNTALPNLQMINAIQQWADRFTGATNAMSGFPDTFAKTRATSSGTMFLAQQGSRMFNAIIEGIEETYAQVGSFILFQLALNKNRIDTTLLPEEKMNQVKAILNINPEELPTRFTFRISTTEVDQTDEAKRQKLLTKSQLYQVYGQSTLGLLQNMLQTLMGIDPQNQMIPTIIQKIGEYTLNFIVGSQKMMEDILKEFDTDSKGYLPNVMDIQMMVEMINIQREQQFGQRNYTNINQQGQGYINRGRIVGPGSMGEPGSQGGSSNLDRQANQSIPG